MHEMNQVLDQQGRNVSRSPINKGLIDQVKEFGLDSESNGEPMKDLKGNDSNRILSLERSLSQNKFFHLKKFKIEIRKMSLKAL